MAIAVPPLENTWRRIREVGSLLLLRIKLWRLLLAIMFVLEADSLLPFKVEPVPHPVKVSRTVATRA